MYNLQKAYKLQWKKRTAIHTTNSALKFTFPVTSNRNIESMNKVFF